MLQTKTRGTSKPARSERVAYRADDAMPATLRMPYAPLAYVQDLFDDSEWPERLRAMLLRRPDFLAAIYVGSHSLHRAISEWVGGKELKGTAALLKAAMYVLRMAARPTPFGQFGAVGIVRFGDVTDVSIHSTSFFTRTRPDMSWLASWIESVESDATIADALPLVVNDLVLAREDRLWISNPQRIVGGHEARDYARATMTRTSGVDFVNERGAGMSFDALCDAMAAEFEVARERAELLVRRLQEAGLLLSPLRVVAVDDPVAHTLDVLDAVCADRASEMRSALTVLAELDATPVARRDAEAYRTAEDALRRLHERAGPVIQVDMGCRPAGTIARDMIGDIELLADTVVRCGLRTDPLATLRERFRKTYEGEETMVPLLELVDPDVGLGWTREPAGAAAVGTSNQRRHGTMMRIFAEALREGKTSYALSDDEVAVLMPAIPDERLPDSVEVGFHVVRTPLGAETHPGRTLLFPSPLVGTMRATKSMGRFVSLLGEEGSRMMQDAAERSVSRPNDVVVAELVYVSPDGDSANKSVRPRFFQYELQVGCNRTSDGVRRISPADLYVGLDGDRFYLWSKPLDREVRVVQSHLMNLGRPPAIVAFLTQLADDGMVSPATFNWAPLNNAPFLPRLMRGNVVASYARWRVDLAALAASPDPQQYLERQAREWSMPSYVMLVERDNAIPLRIDHPLSVEILLSRAKGGATADLVEYPWSAGASALHDDGLPFANELIVALTKRAAPPRSSAKARPAFVSRWDAARTPASEWTYAQLHCGPSQMKEVVLRCARLWDELRSTAATDSWFFLRYSEPTRHIRVRFRMTTASGGAIDPRIVKTFQDMHDESVVKAFGFHTYHREVDRYGGIEGVALAEKLFSVNSDRVAALLRAGADEPRAEACVRGALQLLCAFYPPGRAAEWLARTSLRASLSAGEREIVQGLRRDVEAGRHVDEAYTEAAAGLRRLHEERALTRPLDEVVSSLLHMHFNRFGGQEQRGRLMLRNVLAGLEAR